MIRRSFRRGLSLGLLVGVVAAAVKMVQSRRSGPPEVHVETYTGTAAVEHFADASRQQERPLSDWEPTTPLPEPEVTTPLTPEVVAEAPKPAAKPKKKATPKAVDPVDGHCPETHPVKGKLASGLFHVPGGLAYNRTKPDRCYVDAAAAEADGLTPSKR